MVANVVGTARQFTQEQVEQGIEAFRTKRRAQPIEMALIERRCLRLGGHGRRLRDGGEQGAERRAVDRLGHEWSADHVEETPPLGRGVGGQRDDRDVGAGAVRLADRAGRGDPVHSKASACPSGCESKVLGRRRLDRLEPVTDADRRCPSRRSSALTSN